ncbi:hypothetical protein CFIICLFH_3324 [Methylobacterium goesingense]|nr:hypothetical protein CFIICLFH_3324 [Methylobacterium goesingense]
MRTQAGAQLRLTLRGARYRAMVSLNAYGITQHAIVGVDPAQNDLTYGMIASLHDRRNTLTVVLIGALAV